MEQEEVIDKVRDFLDDGGYRYEYNAEHSFLKVGFTLKCKLKGVNIIFDFKPIGYIVYAISPLNADKDNIVEMLKYLSMANYKLINGNFEIDVSDGEIRYKCWVGTRGLETLPTELVDESIGLPIFMFERYGNGIAALALGFSDAETEIAKAEKQDEEQ